MFEKQIVFVLVALVKLLEADDWALLTETLRSYETGGCENQHLVLSCPGFTRIKVNNAAYQDSPSCRLANESCDHYIPTPQRAVDNCHKKSNCLFLPSDTSRCQSYVKLTYTCQPNEFNSRVACENDQVSLKCSPNQRLAVFRASFGRTQYESASCPQLQGVPEETCLVSYATEKFMQICHGKRNCTFTANTDTFSKPSCKHQSRLYLKIVYACVPRKVIQLKHVSKLEDDESPEREELLSLITQHTNKRNVVKFITGTTTITSTAFQDTNNGSSFTHMLHPTEPSFTNHTKNKTNYIDFMTIYQMHKYLSCNQDKVILFISLSIAGGLLSVLIYVVSRFLWQKYKKKKKNKDEILDETLTLPNISENVSEFDNEIDPDPDLTIIDTPISILPHHLDEDYFNHSPAEVVRYTEEGTKPRSLGLGHYYYS